MFCIKCGKEGDWKKPLRLCDECRAKDPTVDAAEKLYDELWEKCLSGIEEASKGKD